MSSSDSTGPSIRIKPGEVSYINDNGHPCHETGTIWYRHDKVYVDGKLLLGGIQVKARKPLGIGRRLPVQIEASTYFEHMCVLGRNVRWLHKMNEETSNAVSAS